jgi:hypothetical protein
VFIGDYSESNKNKQKGNKNKQKKGGKDNKNFETQKCEDG